MKQILIAICLIMNFLTVVAQEDPRMVRPGSLHFTCAPAGRSITDNTSPDSIRFLRMYGFSSTLGVALAKDLTLDVGGEYMITRGNILVQDPLFGLRADLRYYFSRQPKLVADSAKLPGFIINRFTPFVGVAGGMFNSYLGADHRSVISTQMKYPTYAAMVGVRYLIYRQLCFTQMFRVIATPANAINRLYVLGGFGIEWYIPTSREDLKVKRAYWKSCSLWPKW